MNNTTTIAYFDCFSGASGDMILGALVDAGVPLEMLRDELAKLPLDGYCIQGERKPKGVITGTQIKVVLEERASPDAAPHHRHLADILRLIDTSPLAISVKEKSKAIFTRLAKAEAKVHGTSVEEIHFHEVGAIDAIVDIVGSVIGLATLKVERVYASPLPTGGGMVECAHGLLPVPAPATLELLAEAKAVTRRCPEQSRRRSLRGRSGRRVVEESSSVQAELVTPTGAAVLTTLAEFTQPEMIIERIGYGLGEAELPWPNVLRLWLGNLPGEERGGLVVIETNIDDMNPEAYGYVMERLFAMGALDVYYTPIFMKKNRPATMIGVIARARDEATLVEIILRETTTLGVRVQPIRRHEATREIRLVESSYGPIPVKVKVLNGRVVNLAPEYEACREIASRRNVPLLEVYQRVLREVGGLSEADLTNV